MNDRDKYLICGLCSSIWAPSPTLGQLWSSYVPNMDNSDPYLEYMMLVPAWLWAYCILTCQGNTKYNPWPPSPKSCLIKQGRWKFWYFPFSWKIVSDFCSLWKQIVLLRAGRQDGGETLEEMAKFSSSPCSSFPSPWLLLGIWQGCSRTFKSLHCCHWTIVEYVYPQIDPNSKIRPRILVIMHPNLYRPQTSLTYT